MTDEIKRFQRRICQLTDRAGEVAERDCPTRWISEELSVLRALNHYYERLSMACTGTRVTISVVRYATEISDIYKRWTESTELQEIAEEIDTTVDAFEAWLAARED